MSDAPERIWAFYAPEIEEDNPQCTIVAGDGPMHGAQPYIRADRIAELEAQLAKVKAAFRINMMDALPNYTHAQFDEDFDKITKDTDT